jgi:hypothetical protein
MSKVSGRMREMSGNAFGIVSRPVHFMTSRQSASSADLAKAYSMPTNSE